MKNFKTIFLTVLLSIGFILPSCNKEKLAFTPCGDLVTSHSNRYFDIKGIELSFFKEDTISGFELIQSTDTIPFLDLGGIFMQYQAEYHSSKPSFSLIPSTMACTYVAGYDGSKTERLKDLTITTINDFDETHLANSAVNDLIVVDNRFNEEGVIDLSEYLSNQTENIKFQFLKLQLKKAPELNQDFQVKLKVELSTGEIYEAESESIYFKD